MKRRTSAATDLDFHLTRRERQIMDILYSRGKVTVNEIQEALPDPPAHTAVRTMLKILGDKGLVKRRKEGREYVYSAKAERGRAGRSALHRVVETFFDGSLGAAVAAYLSRKKRDVSAEELQTLKKMIEEAEKEGR